MKHFQKHLVKKMSSYVVDENVVLNATHGKKADNRTPALAEKIFMYRLFSSQSHLFMNEKIRGKFRKMPQKIESKHKKEFLDNHIMPLFLQIMVDSSRTTIVNGIVNNFRGVKECDTEFVGVTLQSGGTLVTADRNLREAIAADQSVSRCHCVTVEEAI